MTENTVAGPIIDPEFEKLLPAQTPEEHELLEKSIVEEGCREPLVVWDGVLVDGHNRLEICRRLGIPYKTRSKDFPSREAAMSWIFATQLARRNLNSEMVVYCRGKHYELEKNSRGGDRKSKAQSEPLISETGNEPQIETAEKLGKLYGVGRETIKRDAKVAKVIDTMGEESPKARQMLLSGEAKVTKRELVNMAGKPEAEIKEAAKAIEKGQPVRREPVKRKPPTKPSSTLDQIVRDMYDTSKPIIYTGDDWVREMGAVVQNFRDGVECCIDWHRSLLDEPENRDKIWAVLTEAKKYVDDMKEIIYG